MPRISPRTIAIVCAVAVLGASAAAAILLSHNSGSPNEATAPASAIETPALSGANAASPSNTDAASPQPNRETAGQPTCQTATATNCDRGNLQQSAGTRGSSACAGKGPATIGASPIDLDEIAYIQPMGLMVGGHVTPIDHGYFYIKGAVHEPHHQAAVRSPLAGVITSVTRTVRQNSSGDFDDYALTIEATCTFRIRFSNLVSIAGRLADAIGQVQPGQNATPNLTVDEGEIIGATGLPTANGIDVWVENDEITLPGFVNQDQYATTESWKLHMADLFDHTSEPLRSQLLALDMRDASPRWGKIDYDIDGRLVGNWFRQGSGGYRGIQQGNEGYWDGHLAIVYDGNDPTQIVVSFGNYQGQPQQFAVIGNAPDPADVSVATGPVAYQLGQIVTYSGDTGAIWNGADYVPHIRARADTRVIGTVLMQLTADRQLKVEIFPGSAPSAAHAFDDNALIYER